jgi:fused signal recognition particle receptor
MFRFFKKKPSPTESSIEDQSTELASSEVEYRPEQTTAAVIVPDTPSPVTPLVQDASTAAAIEVTTPLVQTPFRRSSFGAALGGAGSIGVAGVAAAGAGQISPADPVEAPTLETVEILDSVTVENSEEKKASWLARLKGGLAKTGQSIGSLFIGVRVDEALFEELETALIMADAGVEATEQLLQALRQRVKRERIEDAEGVRQALREVLTDHLKVLEKPFDVGRVKPLVVMITGVNGAGKTTSIGKLAYALQRSGARVLLAAGDTFRAAARQQLIEWGDRNNVDVIAQEGADPAAVAFDSVHAGRARGMDVVMVDTAGRLPTQLHLMDELKKIRRVIAKADPTAPHEVLLVVDGNSGQNVLAQIRAFDAAVELTGLIVTKLDGTAKGGTLAAVAAGSQGVRPVPVYWIGVGEKIEDLQPFVAAEFAAAVVG